MNFFKSIELAPRDPLFGLNQAFAADTREKKVNLGVGTYKTSDLKPLILSCVKEAERRLLESETSKDYLPIDGDPLFREAVTRLVLGEEARERTYAVQSVGGTGALRVGGVFLRQNVGYRLFLPDPTWANHGRIFSHSGFELGTYPYYDAAKRAFDFEGMCQALKKMPEQSVVLLQGTCHNPTGIDPTPEQWNAICDLVEQRRLFPFFDFAYQGFGTGIEEDAAPIRLFAKRGLEMLVAFSASKNFGLYAERTGALVTLCSDAESAKRVGSQLKLIVRGLYSNPPCHGGRLVAMILNDPKLREMWEHEVTGMRERITEMRLALVAALSGRTEGKFDFLSSQKGMFSYTGLVEAQVHKLTSEYGIYLPSDGRINVAGLNSSNLDDVAEAMAAALE